MINCRIIKNEENVALDDATMKCRDEDNLKYIYSLSVPMLIGFGIIYPAVLTAILFHS